MERPREHNPMAISLYYGDEEALLKQALKALRADIISPQMGALGHKVLENPSIGGVLEAVGAMTFNLGGRTLIEIHEFFPLHKAASDTADEKQLAELMTLLDTPDAGKHILFVNTKVNRNVKFAKWLTGKKVPVDAREFKTLPFWKTDEAVQHLMQIAREKGIKLQPAAAALLVEHQGVALLPLITEIEKLSVYAANRPITPDDVRLLSNHNENTFAMLADWLQGRNRTTVFETLDELLLTQHPVQLFALTQSWLGNLFQLRYWQAQGLNEKAMAERTKKHPFRIKKDLEEFGRVPMQRLDSLREKLLTLEWQSKTGQLDARLAFEMLMGA